MQILAEGTVFAFVVVVLMLVVSLYYLFQVKRGKKVEIRDLAAIDAITSGDVVARCAEMGRPVHFTGGQVSPLMGWGYGTAFLAGCLVMAELGRLAAKNKVNMVASVAAAESVPVTTEIMKAAYLEAGRSDIVPDVRYFSPSVRAYASGVMATVSEINAGANIVIGGVGEEALMIVMAGQSVGALQIFGTLGDRILWGIALCDYILIQGEVFAAAAKLGADPSLIGSLVGEDAAKLLIIALGALGVILATANIDWIQKFIGL